MPKGPGIRMPASGTRKARGPGATSKGRGTGETQQTTLRSGLGGGGRDIAGAARLPPCGCCRGRAQTGPRALPLRRLQVRPRIRPFRLCRARRAQGRRAAHGDGQHLQHAQSLHAQGRGGGGHGLPLREPAGRRGGRGGFGLRSDRPSRHSGAGPALGAFPPQARGALARRHADHGRRRGVLVRDPDHRGRSRLRHAARRRRPGRHRRQWQCRLSPRRSRQPQAAADRREHADRLRGVFQGPRLRRDHHGPPARLGPLPHRQGRCGALDFLRAGRGLLGGGRCRSIAAATTSAPSSSTTTATAPCWWRR